MSKPFPSKEEIEFFIENEAKFGEWEPRFGNLAIERYSGDLLLIVGVHEYSLDVVPISWEGWKEGMIHSGLQEYFIPIFCLDQLVGMLNEREIACQIAYSVNKEAQATIRLPGQGWADEKGIVRVGPTPIIALAKCLMEAIEKEGKNE